MPKNKTPKGGWSLKGGGVRKVGGGKQLWIVESGCVS